jgi:hypothetical protein
MRRCPPRSVISRVIRTPNGKWLIFERQQTLLPSNSVLKTVEHPSLLQHSMSGAFPPEWSRDAAGCAGWSRVGEPIRWPRGRDIVYRILIIIFSMLALAGCNKEQVAANCRLDVARKWSVEVMNACVEPWSPLASSKTNTFPKKMQRDRSSQKLHAALYENVWIHSRKPLLVRQVRTVRPEVLQQIRHRTASR